MQRSKRNQHRNRSGTCPSGTDKPPGSRSAGARNLVLLKYRAVIFINGCFWHGHRGCTKYVEPKTNAGFWKEKIARNIARDELGAQRLDTLAWTVITVWECELSKKIHGAINIQIKHLPLTEPVYCGNDLYCFVPHSDSLGRIECNQRQLITFESLRSCQQTIEFSITCLLS